MRERDEYLAAVLNGVLPEVVRQIRDDNRGVLPTVADELIADRAWSIALAVVNRGTELGEIAAPRERQVIDAAELDGIADPSTGPAMPPVTVPPREEPKGDYPQDQPPAEPKPGGPDAPPTTPAPDAGPALKPAARRRS